MLVSFVQAVVACNATTPKVCTLVLNVAMRGRQRLSSASPCPEWSPSQSELLIASFLYQFVDKTLYHLSFCQPLDTPRISGGVKNGSHMDS